MYCSFEEGESIFVLSIPHDGEIIFPGRPRRTETEGWEGDCRDVHTHAFGKRLQAYLEKHGQRPAIVEMNIHRVYLDVNRAPEREPYCDEAFAEDYRFYHHVLDQLIANAVEKGGRAILLDLHGYIYSPGPEVYDVILGSDSHRTSPFGVDKRLHSNLRSAGFSVVFSPSPAEGVTARYRGGWIVRNTAARWSTRVDACQIEISPYLRTTRISDDVEQRLRLLVEIIGKTLIETSPSF